MTIATCLACGEKKWGAFSKCKQCDYVPATGWEMSVSTIFSDHYIPVDQLAQLRSAIRADVRARQKHNWAFDTGAITLITSQFDDSTWRDPLTLRREAKQGIFTKQMNWHFTGPNGYRAEVMTRGKELPKGDFDALTQKAGLDAFFFESYSDGQLQTKQVTNTVWYCMADIMTCIERVGRGASLEVTVLITKAEKFTVAYLKEKHGIDLSSTIQARSP